MTTTHSPIDLTQRPPRSPRLKLGGFVFLPRLLDKARAAHADKLGEYRFNGRGMDRHFFNFTGLDHEALRAEVAKGGGDGELLAWVHAHSKHARTPWEIMSWSEYMTHRTPDSDAETLADFAAHVAEFSKTREDISTWFDLIDLDDHCTFGGLA
ncbi:DUF5069 domain-containing protein [Oleiharenicola lentus]|uniref:DUF5069 domain-containing protein n=1 Tax=Oleiharenicola lentus TaxID=2508720 RepID=UPI003F6699CA